MKKKEIFVITLSLITVGVALYLIVQMLFPPAANQVIEKESENIPTLTTDFDDDTYREIEDLSDYGLPGQENIGKSDLFAN